MPWCGRSQHCSAEVHGTPWRRSRRPRPSGRRLRGDSDPPAPAADGATAPAATDRGAATQSSTAAGAALELNAENIAFSASSLEADAGEVTIRFVNNDDGVLHNLHVTGDGVDQKTDVEPGPVNQRLAMTLASGTYTYVCDVHPQQMRGEPIVR